MPHKWGDYNRLTPPESIKSLLVIDDGNGQVLDPPGQGVIVVLEENIDMLGALDSRTDIMDHPCSITGYFHLCSIGIVFQISSDCAVNGFGSIGSNSNLFTLAFVGAGRKNRKEKTVPAGPCPAGAFGTGTVGGDFYLHPPLPGLRKKTTGRKQET